MRVDSRHARVALVQTRALAQQLKVSGSLQKRPQSHGQIPGRLLIEALAQDGSVLQQTLASYRRRNEHSGRAHFSQTLAVAPASVRAIRVTPIGLGQTRR